MEPDTGTLADYFAPRKEPGEAGLPVLSVTMNDGLVPRESLDRRMESAMEATAHSLVEPGDIAYNMMRMWQGASGLCSLRANISPAYVVMTPKANTDPSFAAHWLKSKDAIDLLWAYSHGLTEDRLRLYPDDFLMIPAVFPPLPEQRRIAAVLDTWDAAILTTDRLVKAKRARFDWIRDEALTGRTRLRGFNNVWRTVRLSDVLIEHGLCATGTEAVFSVSVNKGLVNQIEHLGRSFSAKETGHYNRVLPGDIVYTKSPTGSFPLGIIKQSKVDVPVIVSPLYGVFTPESRELGIILDAYFASPKATEKYLTPLVQKGAKNTIAVTNSQFLQGSVSVPGDVGEGIALAEMVSAATAELTAVQTELERFRQQKRGLMQQLLTGKLRVPESIDALLPSAARALDVAA